MVALSLSDLQLSGKSHPVMFSCHYTYMPRLHAQAFQHTKQMLLKCKNFIPLLLCLAGPLPELAMLQHLQNLSAAHNQLTGASP